MAISKVQIVGDLTKDNSDKRKGVGFRRSKKQWEASIGEHIGKFFDKMTVNDINTIIKSLATIGAAWYIYPPTRTFVEMGIISWEDKKRLKDETTAKAILLSIFLSYMAVEQGKSLTTGLLAL